MSSIVGVGQISLTDLNDAIISGSAPSNPTNGTLWIDSSITPNVLKKWDGANWIIIGEIPKEGTGIIIEEIEETLGNMVNDDLINFNERQVVKDKLTEIIGYIMADGTSNLPASSTLDSSGKGGFYSVRKSALNAGISESNTTYIGVATQYNNLRNYLNGLSPRPWDLSESNKNLNTGVTKETFRDKWLQYYIAVDALATATAEKLKENVDNIEVGGRNLARNSTGNLGLTGWSTINSGQILVLEEGGGYQGNNAVSRVITSGAGGMYVPFADVVRNEVYTMSFWVKTDKDCSVSHLPKFNDAGGTQTNPLTTDNISIKAEQWNRIVYTFTTPATSVKASTTPRVSSGSFPVKLYISQYKIEKGNKVTDWTPAPEDIDEQIEETKASISSINGEIALTVKKGSVINDINVSSEGIRINADKVNINGAVTFSSLNSSLQSTFNSDGTVKSTRLNGTISDNQIASASNWNSAKSYVDNMSSDNKLTPSEKKSLKIEFDAIVKEKGQADSIASTYGYTSNSSYTNYVSAYNTLYNYVNPILSNLTTTSDINGGTMRSHFANYYEKAQIFEKAINARAKAIADSKADPSFVEDKISSLGDLLNYASWDKASQDTSPWSPRAIRDTSKYRSNIASLRLPPDTTSVSLSRRLPVSQGDRIYYEFWVITDSNWNGNNDNSKLRFGNQNNSLMFNEPYAGVKSSWTKYSGIWTVPSGVTYIVVSLGNNGSVGNIWIDDIILVKQANDVMISDGAISNGKLDSTTQTRVSNGNEAKSTIDSKGETWDRAGNINANGTFDTKNLSGVISDTQISSAETWSNKADPSYVDGKVDEIQVGGRNYAKNSKVPTISASNYGSGTYSTSYPLMDVPEFGLEKVTQINRGASGTGDARFAQDGKAQLENIGTIGGKTFTLSFYAKAKGTSPVSVTSLIGIDSYRGSVTKTIPNDKWVRMTKTQTFPVDRLETYLRVYFDIPTNSSVYVALIKVEEGNKATDWTPAPEDVDGSIATAESNAKEYTNKLSTKGLGMKVNHSTFTQSNPGELYMHGYDSNGNPADVDGYLIINGEKHTVPKGMINPNRRVPRGYIMINVSSNTWYLSEYNTSNQSWTAHRADGSGTVSFNPQTYHAFVGTFTMDNDENFTHAVLWNDYKDYIEISRLVEAEFSGVTINNNSSTWNRAGNINSNGTLNTEKLAGTVSDNQVASSGNWNSTRATVTNNSSVWGRASNINANGTLDTSKLSGVIPDTQLSTETQGVINGYITTSTGSSNAGKWTRLVSFRITSRYGYASTDISLINGANGGSTPWWADVSMRVKQQNAMGDTPYIEIHFKQGYGLLPTDFGYRLVNNNTSETYVILYLRIRNSHDSFKFTPSNINSNSGEVRWWNDYGFGDSFSASGYAVDKSHNPTTNTVNEKSGTWDRAGNINSDGTFDTEDLKGVLTDAQIASASKWNSAETLLNNWKSGTTMINGGLIATNSIFATSLTLGNFDNLIDNPNFLETIAPHNRNMGSWTIATGSTYTRNNISSLRNTTSGSSEARVYLNGNHVIQVSQGERYYFSIWIKHTGTGTPNNVSLSLRTVDGQGNYINFAGSTNFRPTTNWVKYEISAIMPTNAYYMAPCLRVLADGNNADICFSNAYLRQMFGGELVVNGSITADHMNVTNLSAISANIGDVTAGRITGVTITSTNGNNSTVVSGGQITSYGNFSRTFNDNRTAYYRTRVQSGDGVYKVTILEKKSSTGADLTTSSEYDARALILNDKGIATQMDNFGNSKNQSGRYIDLYANETYNDGFVGSGMKLFSGGGIDIESMGRLDLFPGTNVYVNRGDLRVENGSARAIGLYANSLDINTTTEGTHVYIRPASSGEVRTTSTGSTTSYVPIRTEGIITGFTNLYLQGSEVRVVSTGESTWGASPTYSNLRASFIYANALDINTGTHVYARPASNGYLRVTATGTTGTFRPIEASNVAVSSMEKHKTGIMKSTKSALSIFKKTTMYDYDLKDELQNGIRKGHVGFVIGRETPQELISDTGESISIYDTLSLAVKAIQELTERIEFLEKRY